VPAAPGRFLTITGVFKVSPTSLAINLAKLSVGAPAGKGTTIVISLLGQAQAHTQLSARPIHKISFFMVNDFL
jgi:hypothetical protein